jgi:CMP-N,N'-diacetyllegionaminic acid synthase
MKSPLPIWAIIPTRGGSNGLLEKNILTIAGKPMLCYMIEAALKSKLLTRIILTTDSNRIADVASKITGVDVLKHDADLSKQGCPSFYVFQNTLKQLIKSEKKEPKVVVLLRVTTPLCISTDIDNCLNIILKNSRKATSALSVTKSDIHPKRTYLLEKNGRLRFREKTHEINFPFPRQKFNDVYIRNGAIYATFPHIVLGGSLWGERPFPYIMPKERSVNINDEIDFILAEELLKRRKQ